MKGRHHRKYLKKCAPLVRKINEYEKEFQSLSEEQLKAKTEDFMERYKKGESLEDMLPEAFAVVKNAARRMCGTTISVCDHPIQWEMIHYDVQLIGGLPCMKGILLKWRPVKERPWSPPVHFI